MIRQITPAEDPRVGQLLHDLMTGTGMRSVPYTVLWLGKHLALVRWALGNQSPTVHRVTLVDPRHDAPPEREFQLQHRKLVRPVLGCIHHCTQRPKRGSPFTGPTHGLLTSSVLHELIQESVAIDAQWEP